MSPIAQQGSRRFSTSIVAWLSILTAGLVFLVALGSSRSVARVSPSKSMLEVGSILGDLFVVLLALVFVALCLFAYILLVDVRWPRSKGEAEDKTNPALPWWTKLLAVFFPLAALGGVVAAVLVGGGNQSANPVQSVPIPPLLPFDGESSPTGRTANFVVHWWILAGLALLALASFSLVVIVRRRRREDVQAETASSEWVVRAAVEASLEELEEEPDPRQAVIRAYATMERVLSEHGLERKPSEAPFEYLARCVGIARVSRSAAEALTTLYERARFSLHLIDHEMKREAVAALVALRRELQGRA